MKPPKRNIQLDEIERCLCRLDGVIAAGVVAVNHPASGRQIIAYVVSAPAARPSTLELRTFCRKHLPAALYPDCFVFVDTLPRMATIRQTSPKVLHTSSKVPAA